MNAFVHIIQSPSSADLLDGRTEGRALSEALRLANIPHSYSLATDRTTFADSIGSRLADACRAHQKWPIIHLSMHGNGDGVQLTSNEFLRWNDLRAAFIGLLRITQGGTLFCLSSCAGGSGARMAMYEDAEYPFGALVGNTADVAWSDAAVAYITFYHLFFKDKNVSECVEAMKVASGNNDFMVMSGQHARDSWVAFQQQQRVQLNQALFNLGIGPLNAPPGGSVDYSGGGLLGP
jgi:hypothetical protein